MEKHIFNSGHKDGAPTPSLCPSYSVFDAYFVKFGVSGFVGFLKGKSTLIIYERHANLKYKYGNRQFWCRGYYVDTAGKNAKAIAEYIKHQLDEDKIQDQITMKEFIDPFKGSK